MKKIIITIGLFLMMSSVFAKSEGEKMIFTKTENKAFNIEWLAPVAPKEANFEEYMDLTPSIPTEATFEDSVLNLKDLHPVTPKEATFDEE